MPTSRRPFWFVLGTALLVLAGFVTFLLVYDIPAPDDSAMVPAKAPLRPTEGREPAPSNPLAQFLQVVRQNPFDSSLLSPGASKSGNIAQHRQTVLDAFETLMRSDPSTWVWSAEFTGFANDRSAQETGCIVPVCNLVRVHASSATAASPEEVIRRHLLLARFTHGLADAGGNFLHHTVAGIMLRGAVHDLERPLVLNPISSAQLAAIQKDLEEIEPSPATFAETIRGEYQWARRYAEAVQRGEPVPEIPDPPDAPGYPKALQPLFAKTNLSCADRLEHDLAVIHALSLGWKEALDAHLRSKSRVQAIVGSPLKFWINPNTTGISQMMEYCKAFHESLSSTVARVAIHRQFILQLALRRYELDHQQLPTDLAALSPTYLSSIPLDPFTGLPMRWNPTTLTLYSVGADLIDHSGTFSVPASWSQSDPGQYYWWSEAAAKARDAQRLGPAENRGRTRTQIAP